MLPRSSRILGACAYVGAFAALAACGGGGSAPVTPGGSGSTPGPTATPWNPTIQEFSLPSGRGPVDITAGSDGNLWFTEPQVGKIGRMSTAGTLLNEYAVPNTSQTLRGIALGSDGNIWFTDQSANFVAKINTSGSVSEVALPANSLPLSIAAGPDGNLWFSTSTGVGKLAPASTTPTLFTLAVTARPASITSGPDGGLWFSEPQGQRVGRVGTDGSGFREFPLPTATAQPQGLTTGPDGAVWVAEQGTPTVGHISQIGRVSTSGQVTEYQTPTQPAGPIFLITGPDHFVYVTESQTGVLGPSKIARVDPTTGHIDEAVVPSGSQAGPFGITVGPDGNIWFAETNASKIGRLLIP